MRSRTSRRAFVGGLALAAFFWALALSVSPQLHQQLHSDANQVDHACAVTFIASGNYNHAPVSILISAPAPISEFDIPDLMPRWVGPLFLLAGVFEHAPPANS